MGRALKRTLYGFRDTAEATQYYHAVGDLAGAVAITKVIFH